MWPNFGPVNFGQWACKFCHFWTTFFLLRDLRRFLRTWFRNANQWYPRLCWLGGSNPEACQTGRWASVKRCGGEAPIHNFFCWFDWFLIELIDWFLIDFSFISAYCASFMEIWPLFNIFFKTHLEMKLCHQERQSTLTQKIKITTYEGGGRSAYPYLEQCLCI